MCKSVTENAVSKIKYLLAALLWTGLFLYGSISASLAQEVLPEFKNVFFFADSTNQYDIKEVQKLPEQAWSKNYKPLKEGSLWVRFNIQKPASSPYSGFLLYMGDIPFLSLALLKNDSMQYYRSGHFMPISQRSYPHHKPLLPLELPSGKEVSGWLRLNTASLRSLPENFRPLIKTHPLQQQEDDRRLLFQGLFFGVILVMAVYNLMLYLSVRDISYLYYVLSILGIGFYFFFYYGFSLQTIWQNNAVWNAYSFAVIVPFTNMMRIMFTKTYLHCQTIPWLNRFLNILLVLCFIPVIMGLAAWFFGLPLYELTIDATGIIGTAVLSSMLVAGVLIYMRGYTPALFFILANLLFVLGANIFIVKEMSLVEDSFLTRYGVQMGVIAQVVLFSLGLAYRLKKARQEAAAQSLKMERMEREKEMERKHLAEKQKARLEEKVKERTLALQQKTEQLQSTILKLRESEEGFRSLNKIKDKLFSVISHDLRGPVATLDSFITLITRHAAHISQEEMDKLAGKTKVSVDNLSFLLDNLLNWSRAQMGTLTFKAETFNLHEVVERNVELYSLNAENKKQSIIVDVPHDIIACGDRGMVDFIVRNLLSNAIKFTPDYGTIKILCLNEKENLNLSISDTGTGLTEEQMTQVLDPENSYSTSGTAREKGTGLGLILCQQFLALHKTNLHLSSQKGKGSCFGFQLPVSGSDTDPYKRFTAGSSKS